MQILKIFNFLKMNNGRWDRIQLNNLFQHLSSISYKPGKNSICNVLLSDFK